VEPDDRSRHSDRLCSAESQKPARTGDSGAPVDFRQPDFVGVAGQERLRRVAQCMEPDIAQQAPFVFVDGAYER
jgi:hypothetical protein